LDPKRPSQAMPQPSTTNLSRAGDGPKVAKTHEGEHHADFSDGSVKITRSTMIFAMCAAVNSCNLGYDIGVSTNAGGLIQEDLGLTDVQRELFVGSLNFWSIFGSLFAHWICDKYGRRSSFVVAAVSFIVGLIIMAIANSFEILMLGRIFVGLGVGFGLAIDPLYIAEISPAAHRQPYYSPFALITGGTTGEIVAGSSLRILPFAYRMLTGSTAFLQLLQTQGFYFAYSYIRKELVQPSLICYFMSCS
jgi:MFS family permease